MKKLFVLLLSVLGLLGAYKWMGGFLTALLAPAALCAFVSGILFTTLFTFRFSEIFSTFKEAFTDNHQEGKLKEYQKNLLIIKYFKSAANHWAFVIVIIGIIQVLSNLTSLERIGLGLAAAFSALLYGFGLKAVLFIPMENSMNKKILLITGREE